MVSSARRPFRKRRVRMFAAPYEVLPVILHVERRSNIQVEVQTLELISLGVYERSWQGGDGGVYRDRRGHILYLVCIEAVSFSLAIACMLVNLRYSSSYVILPSGFRKLVASITYSTSELVNSPSWSVSAKTTYPFINMTCFNNKMRNDLTEKAESSLPFLPIIPTNSEASSVLLSHLMCQ
jgi:hypothetical protein